MGTLSPFELVATARGHRLELTERDGKLRVTGPTSAAAELLEQLRDRRDDILSALDHPAGMCAHCGSPQVAIVSWAGEPFCRTCAQRVGLELLAAESSWVLERSVPTLDDTPSPAPPGHQADTFGNLWALRCRCGMHTPPGEKGHDAQPVIYLADEAKEADSG